MANFGSMVIFGKFGDVISKFPPATLLISKLETVKDWQKVLQMDTAPIRNFQRLLRIFWLMVSLTTFFFSFCLVQNAGCVIKICILIYLNCPRLSLLVDNGNLKILKQNSIQKEAKKANFEFVAVLLPK